MSLNPVPNDGPVMRWVIKHAQKFLLNLNDRHRFEDEVSMFRHARDNHRHIASSLLPLRIDDLGGNLKFDAIREVASANIVLYGFSISDDHHHQDDRNIPSRKELNILLDKNLPDTILASMVGQAANQFIDLPEILKPLIAGRTILSTTRQLDQILLTLQTD